MKKITIAVSILAPLLLSGCAFHAQNYEKKQAFRYRSRDSGS
ncbi:hypothetical protein [Pseudomonas sp. AP19]|nr:hypothetical protein [Pseudomonas sp. AP19]